MQKYRWITLVTHDIFGTSASREERNRSHNLTSFKTPNKTQKFGCVLVAKMPEKQSNKQ